MNRLVASILIAVLASAAPAYAWGPGTRQAAATTAMHVLSKQGIVQLNKLERDIREGAKAGPDVVAAIMPDLAGNAIRAIESEMRLLAAVRGKSVDPYFAYRLGLLGAQVADATGPLANDKSVYRERYYADVDKVIGRVPLKAVTRKVVDPVPYLTRAQQAADARKEMLIKDYQEGTGFAGIAGASIKEDAGRSIDAVADVWYTILTGTAIQSAVSESQLREYILGAMRYYVNRGSVQEIDANYARVAALTPKTPELASRIGDLFYSAKLYDRAMDEYRYVLKNEPNRRDVVEKIAAYYMTVGEEELKEGHLQQAFDAFATASKTDPLHPEAEARRLQAGQLIAERDARLEATRKQIEDAAHFQTQAEQLVMDHRHAEALSVLKQAQDLYENINDEFPTEYQAAAAGLANISSRLREIKNDLIDNAQGLSGAGTLAASQNLAAAEMKKFDQQALRRLIDKQLDSQLAKAKAKYQAALEIKK